jgi:hypothetical protein
MTFGMDLRGLNAAQLEVIFDYLRETTSYVTILAVQKDFVKVEVNELQRMVLTLEGSLRMYAGLDDVRQCLAGKVDFACRQRSDLFMQKAEYGWLRRIWNSL